MRTVKQVVFDADDFGYSVGITRGIVEAHLRGVVTSTSCMVNGPAIEAAVVASRENPRLAVGLHVNFTNEADRLIPFEQPSVARAELRRQFDCFVSLFGRLPTHLDSHQHVHRLPSCREAFHDLARETGLHLRDEPPVVYKGGFYGQWEHGVFDPEKVSIEALERIIRAELSPGIFEFCVHPGFVDPSFDAVYHTEREHELATLTDPRLLALLDEEGIELVSFADLLGACGTERPS